jgi:hypothetical protein
LWIFNFYLLPLASNNSRESTYVPNYFRLSEFQCRVKNKISRKDKNSDDKNLPIPWRDNFFFFLFVYSRLLLCFYRGLELETNLFKFVVFRLGYFYINTFHIHNMFVTWNWRCELCSCEKPEKKLSVYSMNLDYLRV